MPDYLLGLHRRGRARAERRRSWRLPYPANSRLTAFVRSQHKLLIDGEWVEAASGETFETINPATEEVLAEVAHGQAEDIDKAVKAARKAFDDDSPWRRMNASDRGRLIWRISELIEEHADELAMLETLDNGKPFAIARAADVPLAADLFRYMAGWATKIEGTTVPISALPAPGEYLAYTLREPVGVVGQIIPWNFPLLMAAWKLGPGARVRLHGRAQARRADPAVGASPRRAAAGGRASRRRREHRHRLRRRGRARWRPTTTSTRSRSRARPRSAS